MPSDAVDLDGDPEIRIREVHPDVGRSRNRNDVLSHRFGQVGCSDNAQHMGFDNALGRPSHGCSFLQERSERTRARSPPTTDVVEQLRDSIDESQALTKCAVERDLERNLIQHGGEIEDRLLDGGRGKRTEVFAANGCYVALVDHEVHRAQSAGRRYLDPGGGDSIEPVEPARASVTQQRIGTCVEVGRHGSLLERVRISRDAYDPRVLLAPAS